MKLRSPAFHNNQYLPAEYTCQGSDINPTLIISEVPDRTESLALMLVDLDALMGIFVHWLLYNIDPATTVIESGKLPSGAITGLSSFGTTAYGGPCPPSGTHRYIYKLYALDIKLELPLGADKEKLEIAMKDHVLGQCQLIGLYKMK